MALINQLNNLGDAVRERTGKTDKMTLEVMAEEIKAIPKPRTAELGVFENREYLASEYGIDGFHKVVAKIEPRTAELGVWENGEYLAETYGIDGFHRVVAQVPEYVPVVEETTITENGTYEPAEGVDGFGKVTVAVPDIPAVVEEITITENGTYTAPTGVDGYSPIVVAVPIPEPEEPVLESIVITENGEYTPASGIDGFNLVTVNVPTGGGGGVDIEPILLTGDCKYSCAGRMGANFIEMYSDKISTEDITDASYMFNYSTLKRIPLEINMKKDTTAEVRTMFANNPYLEEAPVINNLKIDNVYGLYYIFNGCRNLRNLPEDFSENWDWSILHTTTASGGGYGFNGCWSLRKLPTLLIKNMWNCGTGSYTIQYGCFYMCYVLDEIIGFGISTKRYTSNTFFNSFGNCRRLANLTFDINEDGTPKVVEWKSQIIDLTTYVGYGSYYDDFINHNSGITADKEVKDDATYQALKNDEDWFSCNVNYSRYNHDSAVRTINSLPDASAYLATTTGTNTIKFKGASGALTDGGAINTLTEAEIAVAAAKGWTVTLA